MMNMNSTIKSGLTLLLLLFLTTVNLTSFAQGNSDRELIRLKVYHLDNAQQEQRMDQYLENAYIPALHRLGKELVGVFKPLGQDTTSDRRIYVLTSFDSFQQAESLDNKLAQDIQYQKDADSFINTAHDNPAFTEIETILLRAFPHAPEMQKSGLKNSKAERIYELRSYESPSEALNKNKVEMFNEGGEVELFDNLGFHYVFYGNVLYGSDMPNLMYLTAYVDMESHDKLWDKFFASPVWEKLSSMDKYQHNVSHVDSDFLKATEYSDL